MYIIGIDVGGMSIKGGLSDENGNILCYSTVKTRVYSPTQTISTDIKTVIDDLLNAGGVALADIAGIGIGHPGVIDSANGVVKYSNNIAAENVHIASELKEFLGADIPIFINNDANCAVLGEMFFGAAKGFKDVILITVGTGIGSGIVIDGKLFEGRESGGAEAGHTVIVAGGKPCNCGRNGCYEVYASATALINQTKHAMNGDPNSLMHRVAREESEVNGKTAFIAARLGDTSAINVVNNYLNYLSIGLVNLANVFRPEVIIIGGGISHEGTVLTDKLNADMSWQTFGNEYNPRVNVVTAELKNDAGILGAVALVLNKR